MSFETSRKPESKEISIERILIVCSVDFRFFKFLKSILTYV